MTTHTPDSPLGLILAHAAGTPKRAGDGWLVLCPSHDDTHPSLSVTEGSDGRALVKCHAGCTIEQIVKGLGITQADLFVRQAPRGDQRHVAATYDYVDENESLLFQVLRFSPKGFAQRRPDGPDRWINNLDGVRRVPFRLPQVIESVSLGRQVFVCEGEKDVLALEGLGLAATCNPGGAGKWRDDYSRILAGAQVVVIPDADEPGQHHAEKVADSLHGEGATVRLCPLPGAKDAAEFVARGGALLELEALAAAAPVWTPRVPPADSETRPLLSVSPPFSESHRRPGWWTLDELGDHCRAAEPQAWLIEGFLPAGAFGVLYGAPKAGKTTFASHLAAAVAQGSTFLDRAVTGGPVIYADFERSPRLTYQRLREPFPDDERPGNNLRIFSGRPLTVNDVSEAILDYGAKLVILDTLSRLLEVESENDSAELTRALSPWADLAHELGVTILMIHHARKGGGTHGEGLRGASSILGIADVALQLGRDTRTTSDDPTRRILDIETNYDGIPAQLYLGRAGTTYCVPPSPADERLARLIAGLSAAPESVGTIAKRLKLTAPAIRSDLQTLASTPGSGVRREGEGTRGNPQRFYSENTIRNQEVSGFSQSHCTHVSSNCTAPAYSGAFSWSQGPSQWSGLPTLASTGGAQ